MRLEEEAGRIAGSGNRVTKIFNAVLRIWPESNSTYDFGIYNYNASIVEG
jgi:hypothetical protein